MALGWLLTACASGELRPFGDSGSSEVDASPIDRPFPPDAAVITAFDAHPPADAAIAPADAPPPPIDAAPGRPDAGCTPVVVNLLTNPNFDLGPGSGWQQLSTNDWELIVSTSDADPYPIPAQSGSYGAWLAGYPDEYSRLYQDVPIPAGATNLVVSGYYRVSTEETAGTPDVASVQIQNTGGTLLEELHQWSNLDTTQTWTLFSYAPTGNYGGQTIRVYFEGRCDSNEYYTSFFYDTVALEATVCN